MNMGMSDYRTEEGFVKEAPEEKKDISTCPFCGDYMYLKCENTELKYGNRAKPSFTITRNCIRCGASTPAVFFNESFLDQDKINDAILKMAERSRVNRIKEEEEYEEDEDDEQ